MTVRIIVDPNFGERLRDVPAGDAVWIIESPHNTPVVRRLWQASVPGDPLNITTFPGESLRPDEEVAQILETVEDHHYDHSTDKPFQTLGLTGCALSPALAAVLSEHGLHNSGSDAFGILASRIHDI